MIALNLGLGAKAALSCAARWPPAVVNMWCSSVEPINLCSDPPRCSGLIRPLPVLGTLGTCKFTEARNRWEDSPSVSTGTTGPMISCALEPTGTTSILRSSGGGGASSGSYSYYTSALHGEFMVIWLIVSVKAKEKQEKDFLSRVRECAPASSRECFLRQRHFGHEECMHVTSSEEEKKTFSLASPHLTFYNNSAMVEVGAPAAWQ